MKKFIFLLLCGLLMFSCARVGAPVGGKKDTIPPRLVGANMDTSRVKVPVDVHELRLDFDEYVMLKEISKNLIISPPIKYKKILPSNLATKFISIQWDGDLLPNTTYNFNFGNAIVDNNEGNVLPYFSYAFSTGDKLDNLYISGEVKDALTTKLKNNSGKEKNIVVALYKSKDTMDYKQKPEYVAKADEDGYYELNYLSPGKYRLLAFEDENTNSTYDAGKEKVGFLKEDIVLTDKSISGLQIAVFPSKKKLRLKEIQETSGGILMLFEGRPEKVDVIPADRPKDYKITHKAKSDSVNIWFDAVKEDIGQKNSEQLKFRYTADGKKDSASIFYRYNVKNDFTISNDKGSTVAPKTDFKILANWPVESLRTEKWQLVNDSLKQDFKAKISEVNAREIIISSDFKPGKKYSLTIPKESISSYYKNLSKSYRFDFEVDKTENYGSFTLKLLNASANKKWVQLLNENDEVVDQKFTAALEVKFEEIKPTTYTLRILEDDNGNGYWDEADFSQNIFAEDSYLFPKKIDIKPMWEIVETWDLKDNTAVSAKP